MNLKQTRMIKFDKETNECRLVPYICTCPNCLLGLFDDCQFGYFKNLVLKKKLNGNLINIPEPEPAPQVQNSFSMDYPVEYNYLNNLRQLPVSEASNSPRSIDEMSSSEFIQLPIPTFRDDTSSEEETPVNHHLDVDFTALESSRVLNFEWKSNDHMVAFQKGGSYFTDYVSDFYRLLDEKSTASEIGSDVRFLDLLDFQEYTKTSFKIFDYIIFDNLIF